MTDVRDEAGRVPPDMVGKVGRTLGYFMRYGSDHHAFVLRNKRLHDLRAAERAMSPQITTNQITWQVGSLAEVVDGHDWLVEHDHEIRRAGRDMPGCNWHTYLYDPDRFVHELDYGIERIGWSGDSKPHSLHHREVAPLPQISEQQEIDEALAAGIDLPSGLRVIDPLSAAYEVDGVLLPVPARSCTWGRCACSCPTWTPPSISTKTCSGSP